MNKKIIHVTSRSPLHMSHTFWQKLPMGNFSATSLLGGYEYLFLQHHGKPEAAARSLVDPVLMWSPELIFNNIVSVEVPKPNIKWVIRQVEIMRAIMLYQLECTGSAFLEAFENELMQIPVEDRRNIEFVVYGGNSELVFSCGRSYSDMQRSRPAYGFQFYAELLSELAGIILDQRCVEGNDLFTAITTDFNYFAPKVEKSLFVASDSQGKFFNNIVGGQVVAVSGGNFGHIVRVLQREELEVFEHPWVIVYVGANCRAKSDYAAKKREFDWRNLKAILVEEASKRNDGSIVLCTNFEHPCVDVSPGLANRIEDELSTTKVRCINWQTIGNPFLNANGRPKVELFDAAKHRSVYRKEQEIHLNQSGLSVLWKRWCEFIPELRYLPMTMSGKPLAIPKWLFDDPQNEPHMSAATSSSSSMLALSRPFVGNDSAGPSGGQSGHVSSKRFALPSSSIRPGVENDSAFSGFSTSGYTLWPSLSRSHVGDDGPMGATTKTGSAVSPTPTRLDVRGTGDSGKPNHDSAALKANMDTFIANAATRHSSEGSGAMNRKRPSTTVDNLSVRVPRGEDRESSECRVYYADVEADDIDDDDDMIVLSDADLNDEL